jgi:hypothetical protein
MHTQTMPHHPIVIIGDAFTMPNESQQILIDMMRTLPTRLAALVRDLDETDLTTPYRPGEWTVAQNVHHLADSHMNAYVRTRLILTEDTPALRGFPQDAWAALPDADDADLSASLALLHGLHARWADLFQNLEDAAWSRTGEHNEAGTVTVARILESYVNHGENHIDQINETLAAKPS